MVHAPPGYQRAPLPPAKKPELDAPKTPSPRRDAYFDNAKYLAIVLVAMAHSWEPIMDGSRATHALYMVVYTFHMPAFIIVSGYFSRSFDMRPDRLKRLITGVAVPYVVFETTYSLYERWMNNPHFEISLLDPFFLTWFLAALFIWRLTTPLWKLVRHPVPVALAMCLLASIAPSIGPDFDLMRILQFLPFFVLGLNLRPEHFAMVQRRAVRVASVPVFAGALVFAYWASPRMSLRWFYRSFAVQDLAVSWWVGMLTTLALFGCSLVLTVCFLAWVPRRRTWFTVLGAGTICGYLLHGLLIKTIDYTGWFDTYHWLSEPLGEVVVTLAIIVAVTAFCTPSVRRVMRCVTEPEMKWAFRRAASSDRVA
ncbi:acyltransferase family protein [Streptomyces beijiangensis]|uniref:Acyltransferase family protein n=1 Tax=Streptomyces beijiangensis TaxID=163361 RepID=A0A939F9Y8_9ACTN|nr:acyltransferase family protein [Streptomyces beijiangensis]MBO0514451.1 acyltransferase family protein [Streptomyces beijiangensis]